MIFPWVGLPILAHSVTERVVRFDAAPGPVDNPLKGWCPYTVVGPLSQPYSMVFLYVPWRELEPVEGRFRFQEWEDRAWNVPLAKGKHIVFRVYADYPGRPSGVPGWLKAKGVKLTRYSDYGGGLSPDYNDRRTISAMTSLIAALGRRYDRNPRVAFVEMGLLGFWGEWHTFPRTELFASPAVQRTMLEAAHAAFPDKVVMTRYPRGPAGQPWLGYFDDMFPEDTEGPEGWKFLSGMRTSGRTSNWKVAAIGGEMVPGQAPKWLGSSYLDTIKKMVDAHLSWVGPYGPAQVQDPSPEFTSRCSALVRTMGYQFQLTGIRLPSVFSQRAGSTVEVMGLNTGIAPFYYRWPVRMALIDRMDRVRQTFALPIDIRGWVPGTFRFKASPRWTV